MKSGIRLINLKKQHLNDKKNNIIYDAGRQGMIIQNDSEIYIDKKAQFFKSIVYCSIYMAHKYIYFFSKMFHFNPKIILLMIHKQDYLEEKCTQYTVLLCTLCSCVHSNPLYTCTQFSTPNYTVNYLKKCIMVYPYIICSFCL